VKHHYKSNEAARQAKSLGKSIVDGFALKGITNASCKLDDRGRYGIFFDFNPNEIHVLVIEDHRKSQFDPKKEDPPLLSLQYRTIYALDGSGSRPICNGLTVGKTLPSLRTILNNLGVRYIRLQTSHFRYLQADLETRVFKLETQSLEEEFPRFKANVGGEPGTGSDLHSIHFDKIPIGRARQILEILTKYLPEDYEVGEGN